jgi:formylglycine-generating enzyme required for sulfatase activity
MKTPEQLTEADLDAALNDLFPGNEFISSETGAAQFVLNQDYNVAIDPARERELLRRLGGKRGGGGLKFWLPIVLIPLMFCFVWYMLYNRPPQQANAKAELQKQNDPAAKKETVALPVTSNKPVTKNNRVVNDTASPLPVFQPFEQTDAGSVSPVATSVVQPPPRPVRESFEMYLALKDSLVAKIRGIDESLYTRVEEGQITYRGSSKGVDAFVIRNFAITNREYKVFLADLYSSGDMVTYNEAMVNTALWNRYQCPQLAATYFSDTRYDDFPVVNISSTAMGLFCRWLETQLNSEQRGKKNKPRRLQVRLPYDYEWIHAARVGYADVPDCGGYNTIYDPHDSLVDRTFVRRMAQVKKYDTRKLTVVDKLFATNRYGMSEQEILAIYETALQEMNKAGNSYTRNMANGNKTGHVSEVIRSADGNTTIMGSCWSSKATYVEMKDAFRADNGSPFVGFRVIISNADKGTFKKPFW